MPTHHDGSPQERGALNAYITLVRAAESVSARLNLELHRAGLTESQFGILEALHHLGPMCQVDLGRKLLKTGGNITTVLDNLEKRHLVRRERQIDDRRFVRVHITDEGSQLIAGVFPPHLARIVREFSVLAPDEMETLRTLCRRLGLQRPHPSFSPGETNQEGCNVSSPVAKALDLDAQAPDPP